MAVCGHARCGIYRVLYVIAFDMMSRYLVDDATGYCVRN